MSDAALVTGAFAEFLDSNRAALNHDVATTVRQSSGFDADAFAEVLRTSVAPVVDAVDRLGAGFVTVVSRTLFSVALDLCGQRRFDGAVRDGWNRLLPVLAPQIVTDPQRVIASITNALDSLGHAPGARVDQWIALVAAAAPHAPIADDLLRAGQVAAWRAGMAAYRTEALAIARDLDPGLAAAALGVRERDPASPATMSAVLDRLDIDPWFDPSAGTPTDVPDDRGPVAVGAFRGFGGPFVRPPAVVTHGEHVVATDGTDSWFVFADAFGTAVVRAGASGAPVTPGPPSGRPPAALAGIAELTGWVRTTGSLVATSALTHAVLVVPAAGGTAP